jgi:O-antigen ligase
MSGKKQSAPTNSLNEVLAPEPSWRRKILSEPAALALAPLIVLRVFSDGPTFPTNNFYFVAVIMALLAMCGVRILFRGEPISSPTPLLLLFCFWVVAVLTGFNTFQFDATYRTIIIWAGHLALLFIVINGARSRAGLGIILSAVVFIFFIESLWSLLHLRYLMPFIREHLINDPVARRAQFGTSELDPELIHRIEVNRAFGTFLFPNALGAFLIIGIPYVAVGAFESVRGLLKGGVGKASVSSNARALALGVGGSLWFVTICISYFLYTLVASIAFELPKGFSRGDFLPFVVGPDGSMRLDSGLYIFLWLFFVVILPLAFGGAAVFFIRKRGIEGFGERFRAAAFCVTFPLMLWALWMSYSRGAMLGLFASIVFVAAAFALRYRFGGKIAAPVAASIAFLLFLASIFTAFAQQGVAQGPEAPAKASESVPAIATPTPPAASENTSDPQPTIHTEGVNLSTADLANPASFHLRISYWKTGLIMFRNNILTGVGLGNFGTAYPQYQPPDAGDVRAAHNDYLQMFCETGVLGGLLFCGFWGYFVVWGIFRLTREQDLKERLALGGLYAGVLAFLIHSLVDFNFFNEALAFFAFLLAGVFFVKARLAEPRCEVARKSGRLSQVVAVPILIGAAAIAGMSLPVFVCDFIMGGHSFLNVGDNKSINSIYDAGQFFLRALGPENEKDKIAVKDIETVSKLISRRDVIESFASLYVPVNGDPSKHRKLGPKEPVTRDAFIAINNPTLARKVAADNAEAFLKQLEVIDGIFPHSPQWAAYFVQWYDLLASTSLEPESKQRYSVEFLRWAQEGVKRNPEQALYREWCGKAYWLRGNVEKGVGRKSYFEKGLGEYRKCTELYPTSSYLWRVYGRALIKYGEATISAGDKTGGEAFISKGKEAKRRAQELDEAKKPA